MTDDASSAVPAPPPAAAMKAREEPPVVARLVVEVRSDGTRTIARGALEDVTTGQRTTVEARGESPFALALSLSRALVRLPLFAGQVARSLLGGRPGPRER